MVGIISQPQALRMCSIWGSLAAVALTKSMTLEMHPVVLRDLKAVTTSFTEVSIVAVIASLYVEETELAEQQRHSGHSESNRDF